MRNPKNILFILILMMLIVAGIYAGVNEVKQDLQTMTLGGGCFWCLEPIFEEVEGVEGVEVGYAGGHSENPTYEQVCSGNTGHAEVLQIAFNPEKVSYKDLLKIFFSFHDPTTLNRQGTDAGTQYRSIILYHDDEQKRIAEETIREIEAAGIWDDPIVTEVKTFDRITIAEDYHQNYFSKNPSKPYCRIVIAPKVNKFRKTLESDAK